ncbi:hypothetical protein GTQ40_13000 [Flavobacteriaceae bacterium R38]|nr:hypothetical protein [Flavobacteriaceae bacterium R38]
MFKQKNLKRLIAIVLIICCYTLKAQNEAEKIIPKDTIKVIIDSVATLVESNYISQKIGKDMGDFIKEKHRKGKYNGLTYQKLGRELKNDFRKISNDSHMSAFYDKFEETPEEDILALKTREVGEQSNYGYEEIKLYEENIAYLKISHFSSGVYFEEVKKTIDHVLSLVKSSNALIIDLRDNPGGVEELVSYLASYFFEGKSMHLQEYYARYTDRRRTIQTTERLPGKKLPDLPLYILINKGTGSAAESFAYIMKHLNRAIIIGETSVGGGNGSNTFRITNKFSVQIATWETINAITKTSWEKTGVIPHIKTNSKKALKKALELAQATGESYNEKRIEGYNLKIKGLKNVLNNFSSTSSNKVIVDQLKYLVEEGIINEVGIHRLGSRFFNNLQKPIVSEAIFKASTLLFPDSATSHSIYAQVLNLNGNIDAAISYYSKAIELGQKNGISDSDLERYKQNLDTLKHEKLANKPEQ